MEKKKILIVSRSFYPMNSPRSFRTTELAKEFARQGHEVTVLTLKNSEHIAFEKENNIKIKDLGQQKWKPIELKGKGLPLLIRRVIKRFTKLLFEYPEIELSSMVARALKKESGFDMLISIAVPYPIHWGVARVWKRNGKSNPAKVWIADCGDPYMGKENDSFKVPFYFKFVEKWFFRKTDYVSVPTEGSKDGYYKEFHPKIRVIPQGFRFDEINTKSQHQEEGKIKFAYAGAFMPGRRDPTELCDYLLRKNINYEFHIYTQHIDLVKKYKKLSGGKIVIKDIIPRPELLYNLGEMNFVVNFENAGHKQTPSKLIDYALIQKPILSIKTGALDPNIVDEFLDGNYTHGYKVENIERYKIENVVEAFLTLSK